MSVHRYSWPNEGSVVPAVAARDVAPRKRKCRSVCLSLSDSAKVGSSSTRAGPRVHIVVPLDVFSGACRAAGLRPASRAGGARCCEGSTRRRIPEGPTPSSLGTKPGTVVNARGLTRLCPSRSDSAPSSVKSRRTLRVRRMRAVERGFGFGLEGQFFWRRRERFVFFNYSTVSFFLWCRGAIAIAAGRWLDTPGSCRASLPRPPSSPAPAAKPSPAPLAGP